MEATLREPDRVDGVATATCPHCDTTVVWVADAAPERDLLDLHRAVRHSGPQPHK